MISAIYTRAANRGRLAARGASLLDLESDPPETLQ